MQTFTVGFGGAESELPEAEKTARGNRLATPFPGIKRRGSAG